MTDKIWLAIADDGNIVAASTDRATLEKIGWGVEVYRATVNVAPPMHVSRTAAADPRPGDTVLDQRAGMGQCTVDDVTPTHVIFHEGKGKRRRWAIASWQAWARSRPHTRERLDTTDPRTHPSPFDVVWSDEDQRRTVVTVDETGVLYDDAGGQRIRVSLERWRKWAAGLWFGRPS